MLFMAQTNNLGLITYIVITISLFVIWGFIWRWHQKTKDSIQDTRINLYRRWDDEDETMNNDLKEFEQEQVESTKILK